MYGSWWNYLGGQSDCKTVLWTKGGYKVVKSTKCRANQLELTNFVMCKQILWFIGDYFCGYKCVELISCWSFSKNWAAAWAPSICMMKLNSGHGQVFSEKRFWIFPISGNGLLKIPLLHANCTVYLVVHERSKVPITMLSVKSWFWQVSATCLVSFGGGCD